MSCSCFADKGFAESLAEDFVARFHQCKCSCKNNSRLHAAEKGKKIEITGCGYDKVEKIKVDGALILDNKTNKCDYFFGCHSKINESNSSSKSDCFQTCKYDNNLFVELKGQDISHGFNQIMETIAVFLNNGIVSKKGSSINAVIVSSRVPKAGGDVNEAKSKFIKRIWRQTYN